MRDLIERIEAELPEGVEAWTVADQDADTSYLEQTDPDFSDRLRQYNNGLFGFVGIVARKRCACCGEWKYSAGLWGIEDDSGAEYFAEVAIEEAAELIGREG